MSQSIPEQLNVDRREFADAVNALTKFVFLKYQLKCVPPILTLWNMLEEMPVECHLTLKGTRKRLGTVYECGSLVQRDVLSFCPWPVLTELLHENSLYFSIRSVSVLLVEGHILMTRNPGLGLWNSHKESYGSNDMVHAYLLEDARKLTQDKTRIPSHKDMPSTRAHYTPNACTPKPRNIYRSSPVSKCSGGMSNGEPLILNKVNSRAKVQSPKIRNNNPVEPKNHTHKPGRQNGIGQRFSLNKSSAVHEKPHTPRSCLRWKPTGRIFKTVSLRWIPTGKVFIDSTTKVDSETSDCDSNVDIFRANMIIQGQSNLSAPSNTMAEENILAPEPTR
ncbi:hypothetical protein Tco_0413208 [Tanacetum coccineum]